MSLFLAVAGTFAAPERAEASTPGAAANGGVQPDRLAWFREARFGMYIHWAPIRNRPGSGRAGAPGRPTGTFVLAAGGQQVPVEPPQASEWYQYVTLDARVLDIAAAGEQELVLRSARELGQDVMHFKLLKLDRVP